MAMFIKKRNNILLFFLLVTINLPAQIVYDTIPSKEGGFGGHWWDELFVFRDFNTQALSFFNKVNFHTIDCYGETVYVSTIFGKNGKITNTRIVRSVSPICDSIAYSFVNGLKDWLPGLGRGKTIDIPFTFPIIFDSLKIKDRYTKSYIYFNATEDEFMKRQELFDFFYSNCSQKILNDFTYFNDYLAQKLGGDGLYIYSFRYTRPKKKNRVKVEFYSENRDSINFIIYYHDNPRIINYVTAEEKGIVYWDKYRWTFEPNLTPAKKNGILYLEKNKRAMIIGFVKGKEEPRLAIYKNIIFNNDTVLNLDLKLYEKSELLKEIKYRH